ncbi:MAG: MFS transporter [Chloroflexota bacterium]|nr:MFS transporter [Chloroflexota bacterium]
MKIEKSLPILIAYLIFIAIGLATGLLNIAWTFIQPTFAVSLDSLGTLLSAAMLGGLIAAFLCGSLINRFTIASVLVSGVVIAGLGMLGYAIAPIWIALLLAAFIASIGKGTIDAGINIFVASNYGASQMNWLHACWGIGLTFAPGLVTFLVLDLEAGWQLGYVIMGGVILLLGLSILITLPLWKLKKTKRSSSEEIASKAPLRETLKRPIVWISLLYFFLYGGIEIGTGQLANTLFVEARGIPQETSSAWVSAYWGSFTIGRMLMGLLALRLGDRTLLNISFALTVAGALLLFANVAEFSSFAGLLALGFGLAAQFPILILQTPRRVGAEHASNAIGFQVGCAGLGGAALSGVAGIFAENFAIELISAFIFLGALLSLVIYQLMARWEKRDASASLA